MSMSTAERERQFPRLPGVHRRSDGCLTMSNAERAERGRH
jgi:hypothetical protein